MSHIDVSGGAPLRGRLRVPGDKSISHRALIMAALAEGTSRVRGLPDGEDVRRTADAIRGLGACIDGEAVTGGRHRLAECEVPLDMGNSGTTMRLLAGLCASFPWLTMLVGDDSLSRRPMDRVARPLRLMGASVTGHGEQCFPPLAIRGGLLEGLEYCLPVPSAQVKGAVLLAGLGASGETVVREQARTRAHTEEMLAAFGADIETSGDGLCVRLRPSSLRPFDLSVPGDPSQAAFWIVAACIVPHSEVVVEQVYVGPARASFVDVLRRMGADIEVRELGANTADLRASFSPLQGTEVTPDEVPGLIDEVPALAVAAAVANGVTTFRGVRELRIKETDRISAITEELRALGAEVEPSEDSLVVSGRARLEGAPVDSHGDHRMAMALAVAALVAKGTTRIEGWNAVDTSYPGFERDLRSVSCG